LITRSYLNDCGEYNGSFSGEGHTPAEALIAQDKRAKEALGPNWELFEPVRLTVVYECVEGRFDWFAGRKYEHGPTDRPFWSKRRT